MVGLLIVRGSGSPEVSMKIVSSVHVESVERLRRDSVTISCPYAQTLLFFPDPVTRKHKYMLKGHVVSRISY